jgi:hypothetical protein
MDHCSYPHALPIYSNSPHSRMLPGILLLWSGPPERVVARHELCVLYQLAGLRQVCRELGRCRQGTLSFARPVPVDCPANISGG